MHATTTAWAAAACDPPAALPGKLCKNVEGKQADYAMRYMLRDCPDLSSHNFDGSMLRSATWQDSEPEASSWSL